MSHTSANRRPERTPPGLTAGLDARNLTKHYNGTAVLTDVNLHIPPGRIVGLLGPNGAGKSTTMRICAAVAAPDRGELVAAGIPAGDQTRYKTQIGYLPDVGGLFGRLTGFEHLELAARLRGMRRWQRRAGELLDTLGIAEAGGRPTSGYSHGMARRLGLAIALLAEPPVLLVDEPFDGVDPLASITIRQLLRKAAGRGAAVACSTHLLEQAARTCDTLTVIAHGTIVADGDTAKLTGQTATTNLEDAYAALVGPSIAT